MSTIMPIEITGIKKHCVELYRGIIQMIQVCIIDLPRCIIKYFASAYP